MKWLDGTRARLRLLFARRAAESRMREEFGFHLDMETERLMGAKGLGRAEARRQALVAFGGVERHKEALRDGRGFAWMSGLSLDLKLGVRMLVKSPWLTVVAVIALSIAIGAGATYLEFTNGLYRDTPPVAGGDRLVGIRTVDASLNRTEERVLHDYLAWREELTAVEHLGAQQPFVRNLLAEDGRVQPVPGVEISASAFRLIPSPPLLGRPLTAEDEQPAAAPVVVIGHSLWMSRFGGDPAIVGRDVRLGTATHTIVGVMPQGFGFPVNQSLWVPLRLGGSAVRRGEGPALKVFGRLAPGVTLDAAQAQLDAITGRVARAAAGSNPHLRPRIAPYLRSLTSGDPEDETQRALLHSINLLFIGLLAVCGANVATLVFARTATREGELTVRTALGASRGRIVAQLFAEALVLTALAAAVGLAAAAFAVQSITAYAVGQGMQPPFWWGAALDPATVLYACALAVFAAAMIGIIPAFKATGARMQTRLKHAAAGGSAMRLGKVWTGVIVGQVALTVIFLLSAVSFGWNAMSGGHSGSAHFGFRPAEYLTLRLEMDTERPESVSRETEQAAHSARFLSRYRALEERLEAEPGVINVTYATRLPGTSHREFWVELDAPPVPGGRPAHWPTRGPLWVRSTDVAADFLETFEASLVAGRGFTPVDLETNRHVAVVDETFVRLILSGRNAIGQRVRHQQNPEHPEPGPWLEIIGVVRDLAARAAKTTEDAVLYRPGMPAAGEPIAVVVRVNGDASDWTDKVRTIAGAADPMLRLHQVASLEDVHQADTVMHAMLAKALGVVAAVALLLATAGVYSLLSFTLARRTREIGIRAALGAGPRRIVFSIFSRAFTQVGLGVVAGSVPGAALVAFGAPEVARGGGAAIAASAVAAVAGLIVTIALCACLVPARRALRIQPTEALRADG